MAKLKFKHNNSVYSVTDDTVRDAELAAITDVYGAKNLFPFFAVSTVIEDVTWTVDNAKKIITVNGTAATWSYQEGNKYPITLKAGQKYILSSGVDSSNQYNVYIDIYDAGTISPLGKTTHGDIEYTPQTDKTVYFNIVVRTGVTVSNVEIKPMIRDARITDSTYVPYSMTNAELTDSLNGLLAWTEVIVGDFTFTSSGWYDISSLKPSTPPGMTLLSAAIHNFAGPQGGAISVSPSSGLWLFGTPNAIQHGVSIKLIYIKTEFLDIF